MEEKINISEILKDKPKGIRLYSPIFGECAFSFVREETDDICVKKHNGEKALFNSKGLYNILGECLLFPSRNMRDWSKFLWKKGDILVSNDYSTEVIFYNWYDDTYTNFYGKHHLDSEDKNNIKYNDAFLCTTGRYSLEDKDAAQTYIKDIEERLGGKLNRETLEVEKTQPKFKDGDIIKMTWGKYSAIVIFREYSNFGKGLDSHVFFNIKTKIIEYNIHGHTLQDTILRLATEEEKQQLFSALEKNGKAWDSDKKWIVDLKPKIKLKPFDRVLCRDDIGKEWHIDLFESVLTDNSEYNYKCMVNVWKICIPYEGNESLLGTTKNMEG